MDQHRFDHERRQFLKRLLVIGAVGSLASDLPIRQALAMAPQGRQLQGMRKVQGTVLINGSPAQENALVFSGDTISTGLASQAVFVVGKDAFLVRAHSRVELDGPGKAKAKGKTTKGKIKKRGARKETAAEATSPKEPVKSALSRVKVLSGKLLAVFGEGERRIETTTAAAVAGRSALYIEADPDVTYICCCYGKAVIEAKAYPGKRAPLEVKYHDEPYYVLSGGWRKGFLRAPLTNHTDDELAMLEFLVERAPLYSGGGR